MAVWALVGIALLVLADRELRRGRDLATMARAEAGAVDVQDGTLALRLDDAAGHFDRGHGFLTSPVLLPLRVVPFVGRQHRSAAALAASARTVAQAASTAARQVADAVEPPPTNGSERLEALQRIGAASGGAVDRLDGLQLGPSHGLLGPLADARNELAGEVDEARRSLQRATTATQAVVSFLGIPRRYVLVAANNAEMRAGSGMFLSVGLLETGGGELDLGEMRPAGDLVLPAPGVPVEGDLAELWGWAEPGRDWRNLAMSPRFEASAPVAAALWEAETDTPVDGVLVVDVVTLRSLLEATGPLEAGDQRFEAEGVEERLLHDQYEGLTFETASDQDQEERREELGAIAKAVVDAVASGEVDLIELGDELAGAAAGRHVLAWSKHPEEQAGWEAADISGKLASNSLAVGVLNRGGNKLDPFLDVEADVSWGRARDGRRPVEVEIRLENETPEGESPYVAGPHPDRDVEPGTYVGLLGLNLPGTARAIDVDGAPVAVRGADGPTQALAMDVELPREATQTIRLRFELPADVRSMVVEPGARVPTTQFRAGDREWRDERRRTLDLGS